MEFIKRFLTLIYPNRCPYCGELLTINEKVCNNCFDSLPRIVEPFCDNCGVSKDNCCCKDKKKAYTKVVSPFYYEGNARDAIKRMKFSDKPYISKTLSEEMSKSVNQRCDDISFDIITCVPMSKKEFKARGFNQSELLAKGLKINSSPIIDVDLLVKLYDIAPQHSLSSNQRQGNVFGVFDIAKNKDVKGKTILLCDDVKTTGSTANECANVLLLAGAREVHLVCAAVVKSKKTKH